MRSARPVNLRDAGHDADALAAAIRGLRRLVDTDGLTAALNRLQYPTPSGRAMFKAKLARRRCTRAKDKAARRKRRALLLGL
jgi:hypothetical protein